MAMALNIQHCFSFSLLLIFLVFTANPWMESVYYLLSLNTTEHLLHSHSHQPMYLTSFTSSLPSRPCPLQGSVCPALSLS